MLSRAMEVRRFAVLVSAKPGQRRLQVAELVAKALRRSGREALLVVLDEVTREALENLAGFEAFVNTACPRLAVDDAEIFPAPVVNVGELKYVLKGSLDGYSPRDVFLFDLRGLGA
jgi:2-(3-amino-3-carboxypropyl)histidine synthase